ncbi:MAG TPA: hypothetical protein VFU86_06690 [Terriglobales bacterium]|nr:hypothetical protein [Terriglobales bacterium]
MTLCIRKMKIVVALFVATVMLVGSGIAQNATMSQLAELISLKDKIKNPDTRTRVDAFHRAWIIGLESDSFEVKMTALGLIAEPVASMSDHIRMPAVYAIVDIANSTGDTQVKLKALSTLREPIIAGQLPIRIAAIDAVNEIQWNSESELPVEAVKLLGEPVRSGNNGVRMPAINAIVRAVEHTHNDRAYSAALDDLVAPLDSNAVIGGMEVRMMAVVAVERIGMEATEVATKAKALGMMQSYSSKGSWEPEAKKRANEAVLRIQNSMKPQRQAPPTVPGNPVGM